MWSIIDINKGESERVLRQIRRSDQDNNRDFLTSEKSKRNNTTGLSVFSGSSSGTGLSSRPRVRDFQTRSNALFGGWGYLMSDDDRSGFQWSKYNGDDDARREISGQSKNNARHESKQGCAQISQSRFVQSTFSEDKIDTQLSCLIDGKVSRTPPYKPKLSRALYRVAKGVTNLFLSKMRKSKHFRKAALIGMSIAFLLSTFFSENSSDINSYIKNYGGFNFPQTVPSASRVVKSTNERRVYDSRPEFVYEHPYISSSYYTSTSNFKTLYATDMLQVQPKLLASKQKMRNEGDIKTRLAIVRPFCEFDAEALPSTFTCWNALPPCKAALDDIGDEYGNEYESGPDGEFMAFRNNTAVRNLFQSFPENHYFDQVGSDAMKTATADVFLFYSQTYSENQVAIKAVDTIIEQFFEPGGWSQCFDNIYAIEANIPQELDLYIPSAQEELYNWVNGPNRQFEAAFRIIQSGEWGDYDGFYLMEGDSVPIKAHWLDVVLSEIEVNRPFAILGAQYDGDKWDNFYEKIPISLLHHTNGNAIYNTSHPLLERLVGQLEVEAPCPYNSIPYDYRMSQMWVEGTLGIVPKLAPKIMLNEEGENITLSNNTHMFTKWAETWEEEDPFKYTPVIHNYAATNLIPRHLGPEYIIHGAKLYSPWDPTKTEVTLVVSEWFFDRSLHLIQHLDDKDHPFSEVVVMVPPAAAAHDDYDLMTEVPVRTQHRGAPDYMDLCEAEVNTDWFMITNSYHHVARHVDLMFTPGTFKPVIPFTPATYAFCFKYPYCKETVSLAQRFNPGHDKVVQDMDMLYNTKLRNAFCKEWKKQNGDEGEDMYKDHQRRLMFRKKIIGPPGPTGTSYYAWLVHEGKDGMYKLTDRSLYGARPPFVKIFAKEEKLDGMSEDELAKRVGMTLVDNSTDCNCMEFQTESDCEDSGIGCIWRPLFETCHPPELIDGGAPICATTEAPTSAPTVSLEGLFDETGSPTLAPTPPDPEQEAWYFAVFKSREHEALRPTDESDSLNSLSTFDDDAIPDPERVRKLKNRNEVSYPVQLNYSRRKASENSNSHGGLQFIHDIKDEVKSANDVENNGLEIPLPRKLSAEFTDSEYEIGIFEDPLLTRDEIVVGSSRNDKDEYGLPMQRCDTWGPSVVHRNPIQESKQNRTKILHEIQLVSAHEESRPRRLLSSKFSPINVDKYAVGSTPSETNRNVGLATPQSNNAGQLPSTHRTILNYGDKHPFEGALYEPGVTYKPLRIHFDTEQLTSYSFESEADEINFNAQIVAIVDVILPSIRDIWAEALSVVPVIGNFFLTGVNGGKCGDADIPKSYSTSGLPDTDMLIFVTKNGQFCQDGTPSYASLCSFDQHMRPIAGNLVVCLKDIKVRNGIVPDEESLRQISLHTLEVGKMLGLSPTLFQHYRNPATGRPWGTSARTVTCVDGVVDTFDVPNILDQSFYTGDEFSDDSADGAYFEVISPTVKQVVRNHFDCQTLRGARLENKATSFSCFGETFDGRFHFDDDLTSTSPTADKAFTISPLSLALLQDSSWYKADFSKATVPVFGRGGGCGFVNGPCIVDGSVQGHSIGFFCDLNSPSGCDFTHLHKAVCDIGQDTSLSQDHCPMRTKNIVVCSDEGNKPDFSFESFGPNSRCFETAQSKAACIPSFCNKADARIDLIVDDDVYQCDYEGQLIKIHEEYVKCPRLAVVCPDIVCPANCSGNGMCDYCQEVPQCICDDPFDESPGCYGDSAV